MSAWIPHPVLSACVLQALERHPRVEPPPIMGIGSQPLVPIRIARWWHFTSQDLPLAMAKVDAGGDEAYDRVRDQVSSWKVCRHGGWFLRPC